MLMFIFFTTIFLLLLSKIILKDDLIFKLFSTYILFNCICLSLSTFNLYDLYDVRDDVYIYQLVGMCMLTLGFLVSGRIKRANRKEFSDFGIEDTIIFRFILAISLLFVIYGVIKFRALLLVYGASESRLIFYGDKSLFLGSKYLGYIWEWILTPMYYMVLNLLLYNVLVVKKKILLPLLYTAFVLIFGFVGAGRAHYVTIILGYLVLAIIFKSKPKINNHVRLFGKMKKKLIILVAFFCLIIIMGYITSSRKGATDFSTSNIQAGITDFFEQSIVYQIGPYRAFDYGLSSNYIGIIGQLYGRGTLAGVEEIAFTFLSLFGQTDVFKTSNSIISPVLQGNQILVGKGHAFNFAYTHLMIYYLDFGFLGIILVPFLYGFLYRKAVNYYLGNQNIFSLILILFLALSLLESNFKYGLQLMSQVLVVIFSLSLSKWFVMNTRKTISEAPPWNHDLVSK